ncbi:class II aldolase/adducin family protein [Kutzneria buriramensis]|uniref:HCOMODA/2-hydroxy-3-carboxy-muconic semialdehyde decarboxylase n=1 Tax=Kutzneria buriramensis TaxID=1045776 RepID=A0A3E0GXK6_9PSEU|nr:class II aldolase/adducin family protein [Kutzneria buriramensis]REH32964.1 HCOMODA/2-hydroxy-3-carboxy-muconic semialdehyde decarboxylase [Kutzneria buriramensis]
MTTATLTEDLTRAGHALHAAGLVTAFGHVSARISDAELLITPPRPLGSLTGEEFPRLPIGTNTLPAGTPREAWMHTAIAAVRPDVGAICRAQPTAVAATAALALPLIPLHGQGALLGPIVPIFHNSRLVRDPAIADDLAAALGSASALVLRGNGAITVGATVAEAVARMWILDETAKLTLAVAPHGPVRALPAEEQASWAATGSELLNRIWLHLTATSR